VTVGPVSRRTPSLVLLACSSLLLTGCGGGSSEAAHPASSVGPTATASTSGSPVDPASGRKISLTAFTAHTLEGYDYDNSLAKEIVFSSSHDLDQNITFSDITVYPGTTTSVAARLTVENSSWHPHPRNVAPVTIDGARWYHLTGAIGHGQHLEDYGTVHDSRLVRVSFELTASRRERQAIVGSVLASVDLK
jgi:hypothetical protein